ncbi:MAG TPA: DUF4350 domain-containing protein [Rhodocyclaceae bacterium]|nr:DUF4350 domain-containing protein [Rhodocyclaceae bacterium]
MAAPLCRARRSTPLSRRLIWSGLALAGLIVIGAAWFLANFDQVVVDSWEPPSREARRNRFLALEKFLDAMGRKTQRIQDPTQLDHLPPGVLVLDSGRRGAMTPQRVENLLAWVERGGYVVTAPESRGRRDPFLDRFDIDCRCKEEVKTASSGGARSPPPKPPAWVSVQVPGNVRPLKIAFQHSDLAPGKTSPVWSAGAADHPMQVLHYAYGQGQVTVFSDLNGLFINPLIGKADHAELLWTLLETYQPDRNRPVFLLTRLAIPSLWHWLIESAAPAVVSGLVLLIFWLWRLAPRFGPVRPEPDPARRELGEHLRAIGRYIWRCGGLETWLSVARESFNSRLARRHPHLAALPSEQKVAALAEISGRSLASIAAALHHAAPTPHSFTQALRTLKNLERSL